MRLHKLRTAVVTGALVTALICSALGASFAFGNVDGDNIPGTAVASLPFTTTGSLDATSDVRDVYAVHLNAGETIEASLTADAGADFDIFLYSPDTKVINDAATGWAGSSNDGTSTEDFKYMAPVDGTYYFDIWAYAGAGAYTASITDIGIQPFALGSLSLPKSAKRNRSVKVSVPFTPAYNSYPYTPITFYFYRYENHKYRYKAYRYGTGWKNVGTSKSISSATYKFPKRGKWRVKAVFWDPAHQHMKPTSYKYITIK